MKNAIYYPASGEGRKLVVTKENADGTVDLSPAEKDGSPQLAADGKTSVIDIGKCPVSDTPKEGHCVVEGGRANLAGKSEAQTPLPEGHMSVPPESFPRRGEAERASDLEAKSKNELLAEVDDFNAKAPHEKRIHLQPNANKSDIVQALLKARG